MIIDMLGGYTLHIIISFAGLVSFGNCDTGHGVCSFVYTDASLDEGIWSVGGTKPYVTEAIRSGEVLPDNKTMKCASKEYGCFSFWLKSNDTGDIIILMQGCWIQSEMCRQSTCVANGSYQEKLENTRFCCCTGDHCNDNVTDNYVYMPPATTDEPIKAGIFIDPYYKEKTIAYAMTPLLVVAFVILISYTVFRVWMRSRKESPDSIHLMESNVPPVWELGSLKLSTLINRGRYGEVWKGSLHSVDVAVKIFTGNSQYQYYLNEKKIYCLPFMEHDSLPRFYGAEERITVDGTAQYLFAMEYFPLGTLSNFLKHNSFDWATMCKLCKSTASGLAHLHLDMNHSGQAKPVIAHRDLNTRNILVRPDNVCVICDFGFAMQLNCHSLSKNGATEVAEQSSLSDVGTIRYMPPEVLEGAVNLRDCEASLKQIDVYALGLVFWEIGTRCADLYQGLPVPEYQLPFHAELGHHPSFEEMQEMVSKKKTRPMFPDVWKDTNLAIRAFKETIEDCWDQDAEARLTAMCVEERVQEMQLLWAVRQKIGVTPTINTTNFETISVPVPEKKPELCNTNVINEVEIAPNRILSRTVEENNARNLEHDTNETPPMTTIYVPQPSRFSVSENSGLSTLTTDTILTPSEPIRPPPNVQQPPPWSMYVTKPKVHQPNQGKNPIVERNTHKKSDEDLEIQGNTLVNLKTGAPVNMSSYANSLLLSKSSDMHLSTNDPNVNSEDRNTSSYRVPSRNAPRIPFMQNDVASEPLIVRPKLSNTHQNGNLNSEPKTILEKFFRVPKFSLRSKNLPGNKRQKGVAHSGFLVPNTAISTKHEHKKNGNNQSRTVGLEVCLENGQPVVRSTPHPQCTNPDATLAKKYINNAEEQQGGDEVCNDSKHNTNTPLETNSEIKGSQTTHMSLKLNPVQYNSLKDQDAAPSFSNGAAARAKRPSSLVIQNTNLWNTKKKDKIEESKISKDSEASIGSNLNVKRHLSSPELNVISTNDTLKLMGSSNC